LSLSTDKYAREVGRRLRETAWELGYRTQQQLAEYLGVTRGQVYTWYRGLALPPVKHMQRLCREHRLTLDWIYSGDGSGLTYATYIRLTAAMDGKRLQDVEPEEEPEPEPDESGPPGPRSVECRPRGGNRRAARAA
jgi:transcriptional regulator with XRE-family HTH domain